MEDLDRFHKTGGLLVELWKVARREVFKDKYKEFMRLEFGARIMHLFTLGIPGLLQTEDVALGRGSPPDGRFSHADKAPTGPALLVTAPAWAAFVEFAAGG